MGDAVSRLLAKWRRKGHGTWRVTLIIDGEDEVYTRLYPGGLSKGMVRRLARDELAMLEATSRKHIHVTEIKIEDLP